MPTGTNLHRAIPENRRHHVYRRLGRLHGLMEGLERSVPSDVEQLQQRVRKLERQTRLLQTLIAVDHAQRAGWERLEATLDETAIRASVARALDAADFAPSPMQHAVLRRVLPDATYDALLDAIPRDEFFPEKDPFKQNLKIHELDLAPAWTRRALTYLEGTIIGAILAPAIVARMQPYLEAMYREEYGASIGPLVAALPHTPTAGRLMLRRPGYTLEPHLDPRRVALTCLIYFARPGDNLRYGTEPFEIDRPVSCWTARIRSIPGEHGYGCRLVKAVPFEPNTALVFLNRGGAHAARIPVEAPRDTRRFAYQFYVSPDQAAVDALVVHSEIVGSRQ